MSMIKHSGFALIEVMVTVLILAIGLSGMGVLLIQTIQATQDNSQESQGMWVSQDFAGRLRANPEGAREGYYDLNPNDINCNNQPAMLCADTFQNNALVPANALCGPLEMATFDKWISTCGIEDEVFDSSADFMVSPELTSECTLRDASNNNCVQYKITLEWKTQQQNVAADVADRTNEKTYEMVVEVN